MYGRYGHRLRSATLLNATPVDALHAIRRILTKARYSGFINFNFKRRMTDAARTVVIFDVNPRIGADLGLDVPSEVRCRMLRRYAEAAGCEDEATAPTTAPPRPPQPPSPPFGLRLESALSIIFILVLCASWVLDRQLRAVIGVIRRSIGIFPIH